MRIGCRLICSNNPVSMGETSHKFLFNDSFYWYFSGIKYDENIIKTALRAERR